jgi:nondiscriminating glutamyl-tRNA synthetase
MLIFSYIMASIFRTRVAPSPTGYLHIGTARTALFAMLFAKCNQGQWYIRLDDTDQNRLNTEAVTPLLNNLTDLGIITNEGITLDNVGVLNTQYNIHQQGAYGPYIQSEKLEVYQNHANKMIQQKLCYWSYLSGDKRKELQDSKQITGKAINWFVESSKELSEDELYASVSMALTDPRKPVLRYRLQRDEKLECIDELLGKTVFDLSLLEDTAFLKSDGFPTYHMAHLIDDYDTAVTLVVRTQEWFPSMPIHVQSFIDYFGKDKVPKYIHLPFILGETGNKKMSKRDGNVNVQGYLDQGYLPEAIINYISFLGWNPGTEKELYLEKSDF